MDFTVWIELATPVMLALFSFFAWRYKQAMQRRDKKEERLNEELFKLYDTVLEPYLLLMGNDEVWEANKKYRKRSKKDVATSLVLKPEYQQAVFKLTLTAPHYVVKALNEFHEHFRKLDGGIKESSNQTTQSIKQLGKLLRAIRKGFGHDFTPVRHIDMVKWCIKDFDQFFPRHSRQKQIRS